ncbi:putative bifunctional diguanylate cyclase/phosphodiesterase [Kaarinaea lacus]
MILIIMVLGYLFREQELNNLLVYAESKNVDLAQTLSNVFLEYYTDQIVELQHETAVDLRQNPVIREFDKRIRSHVDKLDIHLISILSLKGITVLSTNPRTLGRKNSDNIASKALKTSKPISYMAYQDLVSSMESLQVHRYVVTSYVPLLKKPEPQIVGLIEIKLDVTEFVNDINHKLTISYFIIAALLSVYLMVLFLLAQRAGDTIKKLKQGMDKQEKLVQHQRYHDTLTGLPNRIRFRDSLEHEMKLCKLKNNLLALLFIDLDYFQKVNDALGYSIGDKLLIEISERLQQCVRAGDTIARIGGDEFVIILQSIHVLDEAEDIARQILKTITEVYKFDEKELFMSLSIGIAMYPFTEDDANSLLKKANSAMKKAKQAGRNTFRYFTENTRKQLVSRFSTENSLRRALEREEFELYYQPIVQIRTGRIVSVEALLRWNSLEHGFTSPAEFIPLLEETGLIIPVGQWVIENACKQGYLWNKNGINDLKINVNMSARQLLHTDLIKQVNDALDSSGLPSHLLDLEITESLLIEDFSNTIHILDNLNDLGVSLSIDDFGTGYSSLSYLKRMPVDTLKIDQSFVRDIAVNMDDAAIVEAICALSHSLRFKVTAEGLESPDQLEHLRRAGVNQVQGFLLSRPVPAVELEPLLRQKKILISSESAA